MTVPVSIVASIRRCHRRDRGSIPRQEALFAYFVVLVFVVIVLFTLLPPSYPSWARDRDRAACCAPRRVVAVSAVRFVGVRPPLFRRSPSARSVPHRLRPRALLSVPPDERPSARVLRCLASRRCAREDGAKWRRRRRRRGWVVSTCVAWSRRPPAGRSRALRPFPHASPSSRLAGRTPAAAEREKEKGRGGPGERQPRQKGLFALACCAAIAL